MPPRLCILGWIAAAACMAEEAPPRAVQVAEPPAAAAADGRNEVVFSRTRQFRMSGGDALSRGTMALLAEETKDELLALTGEKEEWKITIGVVLHGKQGDPLPPRTVSMRLIEVESARELRIDVHLSRGIDHERFKRAVTAALLYERSLKNIPAGDSHQDLFVPPWLSDGLREATAWRLNQSDRKLYEALFKSGGLFKLDDLFAVGNTAFEEMDGATRAAFRVSSGALAMALLEQPQGRDGFRAFINEVAAYQGEMPGLLRKHFPELNLSETSLSKWWALQFAVKGGNNQLVDIYTVQQSEAALSEALRFHFRSPEGIFQQKELSAWPEIAQLKEPERLEAVRPAEDALVRLSYRCFPSFRPLLSDYQQVIAAIAKNKTKDVPHRLEELAQVRATMLDRSTRARDYLDWFEISRARETSGAFDDYLRLKERLKNRPAIRKDHITQYLDRMDRIFYREDKSRSEIPGP